MIIKPLAIKPQLGDGSSNLGGGTAASALGRLGCIPWALYQAPADEAWRIDAIHLNNWTGRDAIYSLTVEVAAYDRALVSPTMPGARYRSLSTATGVYTIAWGELLGAGQRERILGPFWVMPTEWLAGASIPGLTNPAVNCSIHGWIFA